MLQINDEFLTIFKNSSQYSGGGELREVVASILFYL